MRITQQIKMTGVLIWRQLNPMRHVCVSQLRRERVLLTCSGRGQIGRLCPTFHDSYPTMSTVLGEALYHS